jgi:hypothetical protein
MTRAPDGSYWVGYTQAEDKRVHDLYLRHLDRGSTRSRSPRASRPTRRPRSCAASRRSPHLELAHQMLNVVYRLQRGLGLSGRSAAHQPRRGELRKGGLERPRPSRSRGRRRRATACSARRCDPDEEAGVQAQPRISCLEAGCPDGVVRRRARGTGRLGEQGTRRSAVAQELRTDKGHVRQSGTRARRPSWSGTENDRVKIAPVDAKGIGVASVVAWVKGLQPYPEVVAGAEPGQWYISWRAI